MTKQELFVQIPKLLLGLIALSILYKLSEQLTDIANLLANNGL